MVMDECGLVTSYLRLTIPQKRVISFNSQLGLPWAFVQTKFSRLKQKNWLLLEEKS